MYLALLSDLSCFEIANVAEVENRMQG